MFNHVYVPFIVGKSLSVEYVECSLVNHFVTFYEGSRLFLMLHWICQAGFCLMISLEVFPDLREGMCLIMWVSMKRHNASRCLKVRASDTSSLSPHWELIFISRCQILTWFIGMPLFIVKCHPEYSLVIVFCVTLLVSYIVGAIAAPWFFFFSAILL